MLMYIIMLILVGAMSYVHYKTRYSRSARILSKIPGPYSLPLLGNIFLFTDRTPRGLWITIRKYSDLYYPICMGWLFTQALVSVRRPEDLEIVLSSKKSSHKDFPYKYMRTWLNNGLLTSTGDMYRNRRKMVTPAFHFNMLMGYTDIMNDQAEKFIQELRTKSKEFIIDILPLFMDVSLGIILESAMDIDIHKTDKRTITEYKNGIEDMSHVLTYRVMRPYIADWMTKFLEIGRIQDHAMKKLRQFTDKIVKERREYHKNSSTHLQGFKEFTDNLENQDSKSFYTEENKKKLPMLDILLSAEKDGLIDDEGIKNQVDTFILGGTDTTRMAMAYFTALIAENKDTQDKARAEVCAVLNESRGKIGITELQKMPYVERCLKEALRLYPIGSTIFRYTTGDIQLKNYVIPSNVVVMCNIFDAHRDPDFWPEPEKFDPDRFLPEHIQNRHPFAFIPFSAGPRNCIGQKFAMMELKAMCSQLLYNFYLEPVDRTRDMKLIGDIVLKPQDPFHTKFIRIDRN